MNLKSMQTDLTTESFLILRNSFFGKGQKPRHYRLRDKRNTQDDPLDEYIHRLLSNQFPADYRLLVWISDRTSERGRELLKLICERKLFKRLLVISGRRKADLWEKLNDLRKSYNWQVMINFQNEVQRQLITVIDSLEDQKRTSSVLTKEKTDEIVSRGSKGEVLFLVDIPGERKASSLDLYFLSESRIPGALSSAEERIMMEDSILWTSLAKDFVKSVGKIRMFCHPDIIETCTACLSREKIEGILEGAYRYVTT